MQFEKNFHRLKGRKLLDSPINTGSIDVGIPPAVLLYSDSGRSARHQNTMIIADDYSRRS